MPFVQAKCPECGGVLSIDDSKKAAICEFCGEAFIVQDAVNNYNTYNTYNNDNRVSHNYGEGAVVNIYENQSTVSTLLERISMFLEDGDFKSVDEYCEKVLDIEPENAQAYLGKTLADLRLCKLEGLSNSEKEFFSNKNYQKAIRFADAELSKKIESIVSVYKENQYNLALQKLSEAETANEFKVAADIFKIIYDYKDSKKRYTKCITEAELIIKNERLAKLRNEYAKTEGVYLKKHKLSEELSKQGKTGKNLFIVLLCEPVWWALLIISSIAGIIGNSLLITLFIILFLAIHIIIAITWCKFSKQVLKNTSKRCFFKILYSFIPLYCLIWPIIEVSIKGKPLKNKDKLTKELQACFDKLNQYRNEISIIENEIIQLTKQAEELSKPLF